jgi:hypothetical protein
MVALAGVALAASLALPSASAVADGGAAGADGQREHRRCAAEFHAAVVEDNEAFNARDAQRYEAVLHPRMIFWYDGAVTYGRDAIMAQALRDFATPGWVWTYTILSETVHGCQTGIAVLETHAIFADAGIDRHYAVTMTLVRERGNWLVAIDNVHKLSG